MRIRFYLVAVLLVCLASSCNKSTSGNSTSSPAIEALLQERVEKNYNVGIVVAVIEPTGTRFYSCGSTSKMDGAAPMNEKVLFPIASITKVFTTLLLANDVLQGLVKLSDPANDFLPKAIRLPSYGKIEITLENLATHTSGLPPFGEIDGCTPEEFYQILYQAQLLHPPGSHYEYSNIIGLLGDIEANISHTSYKRLLDEKILQGLGMDDTRVVPFPNQQETTLIGYNAEDLPGMPPAFPILQAAAAIQSSAEDLAKFISANMGLRATPLYPAMQLAHIPLYSEGTPIVDFDFPGSEKLKIGLGWNIDLEHDVVWKNGNFPNFTSFIGFNPKTNRGVVVLANTGNIAYTDNLALHLLNSKIELFPLYAEIFVPKQTIDEYAGKYQISDDTYYDFLSENNHLKAQHITKTASSDFFNLYPMSDHQFFGRVANAIFTFSARENGEMSLVIQEGHEQHTGIRTSFLQSSFESCN